VVESQWKRCLKLSPSPLYDPESGHLVTLGNMEDDLDQLSDADWILEAVIEDIAAKKAVHAKIAEHAREDAIVTTNTSGIPISAIAEGLPTERRANFFGTHFFNPPRMMRLLEMIPGAETDAARFAAFAQLLEVSLGKGVVFCKDTPGFISNRIGYFAIQHAVWLALEEGLSVEQADAMTGPAMGRPKSATFRLCDLIGIDVVAQIGADLLKRLAADDRNRFFEQPPVARTLLERGWLGEKKGQGYYKRVKSGDGSEILVLDPKTLDYRPAQDPGVDLPKGGIKAVCAGDGFAWKHLSAVLRYSADKLFEVADDVVSVDRVLKWGFNWEKGPFEIWDELGVEATAARIEKDGGKVPEAVSRLLRSGRKAFYARRGPERFYFDFTSRIELRNSTFV
jgi:3-hydroxyacyl-CoA dehydrogenase